MGADIVIAVNVGTPLLKREQLNGILGVSNQMLSDLTRTECPGLDCLIETHGPPHLSGVG